MISLPAAKVVPLPSVDPDAKFVIVRESPSPSVSFPSRSSALPFVTVAEPSPVVIVIVSSSASSSVQLICCCYCCCCACLLLL